MEGRGAVECRCAAVLNYSCAVLLHSTLLFTNAVQCSARQCSAARRAVALAKMSCYYSVELRYAVIELPARWHVVQCLLCCVLPCCAAAATVRCVELMLAGCIGVPCAAMLSAEGVLRCGLLCVAVHCSVRYCVLLRDAAQRVVTVLCEAVVLFC
jgi:hypothetical protein